VRKNFGGLTPVHPPARHAGFNLWSRLAMHDARVFTAMASPENGPALIGQPSNLAARARSRTPGMTKSRGMGSLKKTSCGYSLI